MPICLAPPLSLAIDHGIAAAHILQNKMKGRLKGSRGSASPGGTRRAPFLIDVSQPEESSRCASAW